MATVNYTIRLNEADKQAAEHVFSQLGLTLAAGLNVYLKAVARQQKIPFELALNAPAVTAPVAVSKSKTRTEKEKSFKVLNGILSGFEVDLDKEREERITAG